MSYVTTNIRLPEDLYLKLKEEAAKTRKSLAAVIREKLHPNNQKVRSNKDVQLFLEENAREGRRLAEKLKGHDIVDELRKLRYHGKW